MKVVASIDDLGFFARRFLPRINLRLAPDGVEASSLEGRVNVFHGDFAGDSAEQEEMVEKFLHGALKRLPKSRGFLLPIVIVENVDSLADVLAGRQRVVLGRALERWGAAATVMP
jgi:hypothetical protein